MPVEPGEETQHIEEMQDIITAPPAWLVRWGISIFSMVLICVVMLSFIIRSPDIVSVPMHVRSANPTSVINMPIAANIEHIKIKDGQLVTKGQMLAVIGDEKDADNLLQLKDELEKTHLLLQKPGALVLSTPLLSRPDLEFGEMRSDIDKVSAAFSRYRKAGHDDQYRKAYLLINIDELLDKIKIWEKQNVIWANNSGKVVFSRFAKEKKYVEAGQSIFYILPVSDSYYGEAILPLSQIANVKIGQRINIKFKAYPYQEYGIFKGKLNNIEPVTYHDNALICQITLDELQFKHNNAGIVLKTGMSADAEIITGDNTLFAKITKNIYHKM